MRLILPIEHTIAIQWYLKKQLMTVSEELQQLQTKRLEKTKKNTKRIPLMTIPTHSRVDFASELTEEEKQALSKENEFILATLETSEDQVQ
jgi:SET domain-containing protein